MSIPKSEGTITCADKATMIPQGERVFFAAASVEGSPCVAWSLVRFG